jgi:hypothetical protein
MKDFEYLRHKYSLLLAHPNVQIVIVDLYDHTAHIQKTQQFLKWYRNYFLFFTADYRFPGTKNVQMVPFNLWRHVAPYSKTPIKFDYKKLYINTNRRARVHRFLLMDDIIDNGLLDLGYNSWGGVLKGELEECKRIRPDTKVFDTEFDKIGNQNLLVDKPWDTFEQKECEESFLYLVTETMTDNKVLFISEKTWKPIAIGMPFIAFGNPGTLSKLKKWGYKTFNKWWDESYDLEWDVQVRTKLICSILKKLSTYSRDDIINIRQEMQDTIEHNHKLYFEQRKTNYLKNKLKKLLT